MVDNSLVLVAVGSTSGLEGLLSDAVVSSTGMSIHLSTHVVYYLFTTPKVGLVGSSIVGMVILAVTLLRKSVVANRSGRR